MAKKSLIYFVWLAGIATLVSCASNPPPPPHSEPGGALPLGSEPRLDEFNCPAGNCVHWYRIVVPRKGKLRLFVESFEHAKKEEKRSFFSKEEADPGPPGFEITLSDGDGKSVDGAKSDGAKERALESRVTRGSYMVSVWSENPGRPFAYRLTSKFKAAPKPRARPKPRKPRFETREATILEAEGWGADVEALLIDLGSTDGMRTGLKGRLVDNGEEIGKLVVEQVYPDGSRAGVEGSLSRPLGPDSRVEIYVPLP